MLEKVYAPSPLGVRALVNQTRELETTSLWRFIWPAVLLHAAFIGVASLVPVDARDATKRATPASPSKAEVEVDLQVVAALPGSMEAEKRRATLGGRESASPEFGPIALAHRLRTTLRRRGERSREPGGRDGVDGADASEAAEQRASVASGAGPATGEGPRLSLEQLGLGLGESHPAVAPYRRAPHSRPSARRRLQQSMASALEARDRKHGLGAHGKVIKALEAAARIANTPANGRADFLVVVDDRGRVASIEVVNATGAFRSWKSAARQARRALARHRVPLPEGAQGLQIQLEIASRVQRPSGHDPDIAVSLFGIPLNEVKGKKPSKVEVLNPIPKLQWVEVPDPATGETHELPVVQLMFVPLLFGFDPADLGAPTRRVVSGRVVDVNVL